MMESHFVTNKNVNTMDIRYLRRDLPICEVEGCPTSCSPGSCTPLFLAMYLSFDIPRTGGHAHLEGQGLQAAVHARQLGVEQR